MIRLKRIYEPPASEDGNRYLVERLWPRGVKKEDACLAGWLKELAPSPELRRWFAHDPGKWDGFVRRYEAELSEADREPWLRRLRGEAGSGPVTLVFAARDPEHNSALVLKKFLERLPSGK